MDGRSPASNVEESCSQVVNYPEKEVSGIFGPHGDFLLGSESADDSTLNPAKLSSVLRELNGAPFTHRIVTSSAIRDWGVFSRAFRGTGTWQWTRASPNAGAVSACYTEWAPQLNKPHFGNATFVLKSVQVNQHGDVRIIGHQNYGNLFTAAGIVIPR